jgi:hypothetical protein
MSSDLEKKFLELLRKPVKSKHEVQEMEEIGEKFKEELNNETRELLNQLKAAGLNVTSVWDLVNTKSSYPEAIDILLNHLRKKYHHKNKEGIIRALAVKEAKGKATSLLIDEYYKTPKDEKSLRWAIGNTIFTIITQQDLDKILPIVQDKDNGESRQMFVASLGKIKSDRAEDTLIELLDDNEVSAQSLYALGLLKSKKAKEKIILMKNHPNPLIRKEANESAKKIGS